MRDGESCRAFHECKDDWLDLAFPDLKCCVHRCYDPDSSSCDDPDNPGARVGLEQLLVDAQVETVVWSPDGSKVAAVVVAGTFCPQDPLDLDQRFAPVTGAIRVWRADTLDLVGEVDFTPDLGGLEEGDLVDRNGTGSSSSAPPALDYPAILEGI